MGPVSHSISDCSGTQASISPSRLGVNKLRYFRERAHSNKVRYTS